VERSLEERERDVRLLKEYISKLLPRKRLGYMKKLRREREEDGLPRKG